MTELQRCPNCECEAHLHKKKSTSWRFWYECGCCWTQTDKYSTEEDAAREWNSLRPWRGYGTTNRCKGDDIYETNNL